MALIRIYSIVCIVFSIIVDVKSQTCDSTTQYSSCSANSACGCLPMAFADDIGICGLMGVSCSRLNPCQSDDTCQNPDHICIHHPRCSSDPLCYPLSMVDQRLCPPMITTGTRPTTVSVFTTEGRTAEPFFTTETTTARSFMTTETRTEVTGTDYDSNYFNSSSPTDSIMSTYSNVLTSNNSKLPNTNTYYQVIEILVNTSGYYDIRSVSNIDTYGCLHRGIYSLSSSSNQITCNDDYMNGQFRLASFLEAGVSYTVLFTTYGPDVTGPYSVVVYGPDQVEFNTVDAVQSATTEIYDTFTTTTEISNSSVFSNYSSELTYSSERYPGSNKYYEAIQITVYTSGFYTLSSVENIDGFGYLYQSYFNPSNPTYNLIAQDDQSGGNNQFRIQAYLQAGLSYTLIFTTYQGNMIGRFSIVASGPGEVEFNVTSTLQETTTPLPDVTTDYSYEVTANYSGEFRTTYSSELTYSSEKYPGSRKYYEAIQIMVNTSGFYTLSSVENIDGFGYLYQSYFNPSNPTSNLIAQDDQSGGNNQFRMQVYLQAGLSYILVFTTYQENVIGRFSIVAFGPSEVEFNVTSTLQETTTPLPDVTTGYSYEITANYSDEFISYYSSALTSNSDKYPVYNNYYEAIKIMVNTSGHYTFKSEQNMDGYLYMYHPYFNPSDPSQNLYASSGPLSRNDSIRIQLYLQAGLSYTLLCTTSNENMTGTFLIAASGPSAVEFKRLSTLQETTTPPADVTTNYSHEFTENYWGEFISNYSSELTLNSRMFARSGGSGSNFYYEAIQINVYTVGTYRIISQSIASDNSMDTTDTYEFATQSYNGQGNIDAYGYIYKDSFDPRNPAMNLLASDDDNGGNAQFGLTVYLQPDTTYVLVFTTYNPNTIGPFTIVASGPDNLVLDAITDFASK